MEVLDEFTIRFIDIFNSPINTHYKKDLSQFNKLIFGNNFNQQIDNLPNCITHLTFSGKFNASIDRLPNSIKYLELNKGCNQKINSFPSNLEYIKFENNPTDILCGLFSNID